MKKNSIIFCVALAAFGLNAFGFMNWNDFETEQVETLGCEAVAINSLVTEKINERILSDFMYGPNQPEKFRFSLYGGTDVRVKQAEYEGGTKALREYFKANSIEAEVKANVQMDELPPFKLVFTVTKKGMIENVKIEGTSGYLSIDNTMIKLISNTPGKWEPAENAKGEKIDQELVISFGLTGC
ncbi:hypothetical protein [uncultured Kriegella sp.]|uniref:hypothetical protein n=1 Tax=uncultured Kriegella sp. TaxID=1798910 RepID=UPI0030DA637A|tara:strand:+ start:465091 stop:465642 length:552 start_codon:yes stop_codon:yes gene_type:complete